MPLSPDDIDRVALWVRDYGPHDILSAVFRGCWKEGDRLRQTDLFALTDQERIEQANQVEQCAKKIWAILPDAYKNGDRY